MGFAMVSIVLPAPIAFPRVDEPEEIVFPTAEHYKVEKVVLCGDYHIAKKTIAIKWAKSADCARIRGMGKEVKNFNDES